MDIQFGIDPVDFCFIGLSIEEYERQSRERAQHVITPDSPDWPEWLSKEPIFDGKH